jgi:uncharacterized membrane protein YheB (UPF0754 family)
MLTSFYSLSLVNIFFLIISAQLPPEQFEGVLHPAFEEDEIQLIILGGLLGMIVGALQLILFVGS